MLATRLKKYLDSHNAHYSTISHKPAYTAGEVAEEAHISGKELAKTVMVKLDGTLAMAVLPANRIIDFEQLKQVAGVQTAELAKESEFRDLFPDCEVGAMPPFGNLYGLDVYVEEALTWDEVIGFTAGTHSEVMRLPYREYKELVHPQECHF